MRESSKQLVLIAGLVVAAVGMVGVFAYWTANLEDRDPDRAAGDSVCPDGEPRTDLPTAIRA